MSKGATVASNALAFGTGGINIDGSRIRTEDNLNGGAYSGSSKVRRENYVPTDNDPSSSILSRLAHGIGEFHNPTGRFPANLILTLGSIEKLDEQSGVLKTIWVSSKHANNRQGEFLGVLSHPGNQGYNDTGGASRFFKHVKLD